MVPVVSPMITLLLIIKTIQQLHQFVNNVMIATNQWRTGALSFARRALACKEDTELLALCAQVTSRLKELSQLKWDTQSIMKLK